MLRFLKEPDIANPDRFLDGIASRLEHREDVQDTMDELSDGLWWLRKTMTMEQWATFSDVSKKHRVCQLVHADPFTARSFNKPRGYAGDAPLLDLIYYDLGFANLDGTDDLGVAIFSRNRDTPAPVAVRERRNHIARAIDETCMDRHGAAILSAACGHLREASVSRAVKSQEFGRFLAVDQDAESLDEVARSYGQAGIATSQMRMKALLGHALPSRSFDLIYAAGLYDYLDDPFATRLTNRIFNLLRPGGRMIVGNFVPDIYDVGYMETYMAWSLRYRGGDDMLRLASTIPENEVSFKRTYTLGCPDVIYLEIRRRKNSSLHFLANSSTFAEGSSSVTE